MKKHVEKGTLPYPIFAAIDNDLHPGWKDQKTQSKPKFGVGVSEELKGIQYNARIFH
jgi:hypothetical protein